MLPSAGDQSLYYIFAVNPAKLWTIVRVCSRKVIRGICCEIPTSDWNDSRLGAIFGVHRTSGSVSRNSRWTTGVVIRWAAASPEDKLVLKLPTIYYWIAVKKVGKRDDKAFVVWMKRLEWVILQWNRFTTKTTTTRNGKPQRTWNNIIIN